MAYGNRDLTPSDRVAIGVANGDLCVRSLRLFRFGF